jgi:predicted RNase H-like HicB family nuclease
MTKAEKKTTAEKNLEYYTSLKYPIEIMEDDGAYVASIIELPGCVSYGDTPDEAIQNLNSVKQLWIAGRLEGGQEVPEPLQVEDFSGKFVLRIPRMLHRSLDREAKRQRVSLNQYIAHLLSERHKEQDLEKIIRTFNPVVCNGSASCPAAHGMRSRWEQHSYVYQDEQSASPVMREHLVNMWSSLETRSKPAHRVARSVHVHKCLEGHR